MTDSICVSNPYIFNKTRYDNAISRLNEFSLYIEKEEIEGLTLYDIYRQPRKPVEDGFTTTLPVRVLNAELTCPICLCILHDTMVVMECLHRFCSQCITKCLRLGRKECPACRIHVPSRRSLRSDPNFDALIAKIYPNLDEFKINEEMMIEEINKSHYVNNAFTESCRQGIENQALNRRMRKTKIPAYQSTKKRQTPSRQASKKRRNAESDPSLFIDFILRRHPDDASTPDLAREYLRTIKDMKIRHLKKFLGKKLGIKDNANFDISIVSNTEHGLILDGSLSLDEVIHHCEVKDDELILHYKYCTPALTNPN